MARMKDHDRCCVVPSCGRPTPTYVICDRCAEEGWMFNRTGQLRRWTNWRRDETSPHLDASTERRQRPTWADYVRVMVRIARGHHGITGPFRGWQ